MREEERHNLTFEHRKIDQLEGRVKNLEKYVDYLGKIGDPKRRGENPDEHIF